jgi:hypothetical protein
VSENFEEFDVVEGVEDARRSVLGREPDLFDEFTYAFCSFHAGPLFV